MSESAKPFLVLPHPSPQLRRLNEKIGRLAARKPYGDFYNSFSLAARLAGDAIQSANELQQMPGSDVQAFHPIIDFWHRVRDFNGAAALNCAGGNQTLAEALVTFRLLRIMEE